MGITEKNSLWARESPASHQICQTDGLLTFPPGRPYFNLSRPRASFTSSPLPPYSFEFALGLCAQQTIPAFPQSTGLGNILYCSVRWLDAYVMFSPFRFRTMFLFEVDGLRLHKGLPTHPFFKVKPFFLLSGSPSLSLSRVLSLNQAFSLGSGHNCRIDKKAPLSFIA